MDTKETRQSYELSPSGASAPVAVDTAVRSADGVADPSFGGPLVGSTDEAVSDRSQVSEALVGGSSADKVGAVCSPDLWEVVARAGCDWEFSRDGLRAVRWVNLGELLALLGAEQQTDEVSGTLTDEFIAKTGELKAAKRLRLGVWDNMRRRWDVVVDNEVVFALRLELYHNIERGSFSVSAPRGVQGYELKLEGAYAKRASSTEVNEVEVRRE